MAPGVTGLAILLGFLRAAHPWGSGLFPAQEGTSKPQTWGFWQPSAPAAAEWLLWTLGIVAVFF